VILKHHAELAAKLRDPAGLDGGGVLIADEYLAACGALDEGDQLEDAALAGAGVARQKRHLAVVDVKDTPASASRPFA
jgi:hypothetical protein